MSLLFQFLVCTALIVVSGSRLSLYADIISRRTRFSAGLMGIIVLAFITSLPELVTSITSVTAVDTPDLATGDLVGAVAINIFWIALLGTFWKKGSLLTEQSKSNIFTALFTIAMLLVLAGFLYVHTFADISLQLFNISLGSLIIGALYIGGSILVYKYETAIAQSKTYEKLPDGLKIKFVTAMTVIVFAGIWLAYVGKGIADSYGLNEMYVGVLLLAFATTMPEFVVSFAAFRRGSSSMGIGNFLGSNFFNLFIILCLDAFHRKGGIFSSISYLNIYSVVLATVLTTVAVISMSRKKATVPPSTTYLSWDSLLIMGIFLLGHVLLFRLTSA